MSTRYTVVQWNRGKVVYDLFLLVGVALFLAAYIGVSVAATPAGQAISRPILLIRATGACAIVMLHLILAIGPLARLFPGRFAPMLYNRRHFGVALFCVALVHGVVVLLWYGGFGVVDPITAILTSNPRLGSFVGFPFELFGAAALVILFLMAATSHDFWLKNLSPRWWKTLHMGVYVAYAMLVLHVALGTAQTEHGIVYPILIGGGAVVLFVLHATAGWRELRSDLSACPKPISGWMDVGALDEVPRDRAKVVRVKTRSGCDRVAVFRHGERGEKLSAVASVCAHQGGPLGEGKVVDGCITCPWHGYQYLPETGQSPPPYTETIATYELRLEGERVMLNPEPKRPGTPVHPAIIGGHRDA
ncbi:MAG: ferric reductase-like transmembrane domain-containing protein [Phycisphaeraceae bacterium]